MKKIKSALVIILILGIMPLEGMNRLKKLLFFSANYTKKSPAVSFVQKNHNLKKSLHFGSTAGFACIVSYITGYAVYATTAADEKTGKKTYTVTYQMQGNKGLVRINDRSSWKKSPDLYPGKLYPVDCQDIKLFIARHHKNNVTVKAILDKRLVELVDEGLDASKRRQWHENHRPNNILHERGYIWVPFSDDTIKNVDHLKKNGGTIAEIRSGNRLALTLNEPGNYYVLIPHDADLETTLSEGIVEYASSLPTKLYVASQTINMPGDSGMSIWKKQRWHYFWNQSESDPLTHIINKKGNVSVSRTDKKF